MFSQRHHRGANVSDKSTSSPGTASNNAVAISEPSLTGQRAPASQHAPQFARHVQA